MRESGDRPTVTIVMPTYQRLDTLPFAVQSALAQSYADFELLVSDNACSPELRELLRGYGDPRIRYRDNGGNIGATANALAAYRDARGTFLATLHDDDLWRPTFLERLLPPLLDDSTLTVAFSDHWLMDGDGRVDEALTDKYARLWRRERLPAGVHRPFRRLALVDRAVPIAMAAVMRASALDLDDWPAGIGMNYDTWLAYQLCRDGGGAWYSPERLTHYRLHGGAMTSRTRYDEALVFQYQHFAADGRLAELRPELRREGARFEVGWGLELLAQRRRTEARAHLRSGLRHRPDLRGAVAMALAYSPVPAAGVVTTIRRRRRRSAALLRY